MWNYFKGLSAERAEHTMSSSTLLTQLAPRDDEVSLFFRGCPAAVRLCRRTDGDRHQCVSHNPAMGPDVADLPQRWRYSRRIHHPKRCWDPNHRDSVCLESQSILFRAHEAAAKQSSRAQQPILSQPPSPLPSRPPQLRRRRRNRSVQWDNRPPRRWHPAARRPTNTPRPTQTVTRWYYRAHSLPPGHKPYFPRRQPSAASWATPSGCR